MRDDAPWRQAQSERVRQLVGVASLSLILIGVLATLAFLASFAWPSGVAPDTRLHAGKVEDFEVDVPVYFEEEEEFFLVRRPDDTFIALYAINPHNLPGECPVEWITEISIYGWYEEGMLGVFRAPCHGETFDIDGRRIFGPSPRDLDRFPVVVDGDNVIVRSGLHDLIRAPQRLR